MFVDGLSQIGHDLALYVDNIETIGAGISQFVCILQEKSFCLYQIGRMIRNGKAGIRSRLFHIKRGACGNDGAEFRSVRAPCVCRPEQIDSPCGLGILRDSSVTATCIVCQPFFHINAVTVQRHFKCKVIINRILLDGLHKEARTDDVRRAFCGGGVLVGRQQRQIAMQIDASAKVVQITGNGGVAPKGAVLSALSPVKVEN